MDDLARMAFSKSLVDTSQPASMKILQNSDGSFTMQLQIGIKAVGKPKNDKPPTDLRKTHRDALVNSEMCGTVRVNIGMSMIHEDDDAATFTVALDGPGSTKIPGTGFGVFALDLSELNFR